MQWPSAGSMPPPPNLFVTFTCNTKWREIGDVLRFEQGQQPCDRSDLIVWVFHMKVDEFIADIREGKIFGPIRAVLYTVEFQKRGLPHIHYLVWSHPSPNKKIVRKLLLEDDTASEDSGHEHDSPKPSSSADA
ncbi:uncharacterized protein LOC120679501 [Panicum virgatum]|uniref:uncharacterized protein LOC120679501 n=1 Tax=Panicum virgatum TaxID=38727 RepID=UPI0019D5B8B7|nr:uncharacterized protein LOC120679501 [Panicum virgatum]